MAISPQENDGAISRAEGSPIASLPRIAIDAFCETPETYEALQQASRDRHLAKARMQIHGGSLLEASAFYRGRETTPEIILIETAFSGAELFDALRQLAEACEVTTKVIVIGHVNDIQTYREVIRLGVSEYLSAPVQPRQLVENIAALYADPKAAPVGRNISFIGARGGVGSSTIAHNIAWFIANDIQMDVSVVDLDIPFGTTGLDFNLNLGRGIADALVSPERLDDVLLERLLVENGERMSIFASDVGLEQNLDQIPPEAYQSVLEVVRRSVPQMVVDLPCVWTSWSQQVLLGADTVVITAQLDLVSLRNSRNMINLLQQERPNDAPPYLILNQVGIPKRPEISVQDFLNALGCNAEVIIPFVPQAFGTAANNGQMLAEVRGGESVSKLLKEFAYTLVGRHNPAEDEDAGSSWFSGLLGQRKNKSEAT